MTMVKMNAVPELDKLFEDVESYRSSTNYKDLLHFIRRFRKIAPYNAMLIHIQKPGSVYVASTSDWWYQFRRKPKQGAHPLVILRPFGPVAFVYELSDTEGEPFPKELEKPFEAIGNVTMETLNYFIQSAYLDGIRIAQQDYGNNLAGFVEIIDAVGEYKNKKDEIISFIQPFGVTINENLNNAAKLATLYHELGHIYCGHIYVPNLPYSSRRIPNISYLPQRYGLSREVREFEAESVCWLLCERQGINNPSAEYLSSYLNAKDTIPHISIDTVLKAVGTIEQIINRSRPPRKELRFKL